MFVMGRVGKLVDCASVELVRIDVVVVVFEIDIDEFGPGGPPEILVFVAGERIAWVVRIVDLQVKGDRGPAVEARTFQSVDVSVGSS